jgi:DNA-binding MarR family transcriptional regulator
MDDTEFLNQTEHISDIFTRIMLKIMTPNLSGSGSDEITLAQFQALKLISQHGHCTIGSIAEGLSVSQPAATMLVDRMVKRGMVERQPGRNDRRQAEVSLAEYGKELLVRIESERMEYLAEILKLMGRSEREQFVESLERFIAAVVEFERSPLEACLRCGSRHHDDCIVNKANQALATKLND